MLSKIENQTSFTVGLDRCAITGIEPADSWVGVSTVVTVRGRFLADTVDVTFPQERVSTAVLDAAEDWIRVRLNISSDSMTGLHHFHVLTLRGVIESADFGICFHIRPLEEGGARGDREAVCGLDYGGGTEMGIGGDLL